MIHALSNPLNIPHPPPGKSTSISKAPKGTEFEYYRSDGLVCDTSYYLANRHTMGPLGIANIQHMILYIQYTVINI